MKESLSIDHLWNMVYNLSLNMLLNPLDAEDATQSIIEKVVKKSSTFRGDSKFSTWVYRLAYNFLIDRKREEKREKITFELFEKEAANFQPYENEFGLTRQEEKIFVEEVKIGCTLAMLQCLDSQNRFAFILGEIFNFKGEEAAAIMELSPEAFRQRYSRAVNRLRNFMHGNCGLINHRAPCKCRKRLLIAKNRGRINFEKIIYKTENQRIHDFVEEMNEIDSVSKVFRDNPFYDTGEKLFSYMKDNFKIMQEITSLFEETEAIS